MYNITNGAPSGNSWVALRAKVVPPPLGGPRPPPVLRRQVVTCTTSGLMMEVIGNTCNPWIFLTSEQDDELRVSSTCIRHEDVVELKNRLLSRRVRPETRWVFYAGLVSEKLLKVFRKLLVAAIDQDETTLFCWHEVGTEPPETPAERDQMVQNWKQWLSEVERIVVEFEASLTTAADDTLAAVDRWRLLGGRIATSRLDVLDAELECFMGIPRGFLSWDIRRKHILHLILRAEMNWATILPSYLDLLRKSEDYEAMKTLLVECDEIAESMGMKYTPKTGVSGPKCHTCGKSGHIARECGGRKVSFAPTVLRPKPEEKPMASGACYRCGQVGHFAKECPKPETHPKPSGPPSMTRSLPRQVEERPQTPKAGVPTGPGVQRRPGEAVVTKSGRVSKPNPMYAMLACESKVPRVRCSVGDAETEAAIDTGSDWNLIDSDFVETLDLTRYVSAEKNIRTVAGPVQATEMADLTVKLVINDQVVIRDISCVVVRGLPIDLLFGVEWISSGILSLRGQDGLVAVNGETQHVETQTAMEAVCFFTVAEDCTDVHGEGRGIDETVVASLDLRRQAEREGPLNKQQLLGIAGHIHDPEVNLDIPAEKVHPVIELKGYPQSGPRQRAAKELLGKLESAGYIRRLETKPFWVSPAFCVPKANGKVRLVCDYRAVNERLPIPSGAPSHSLTDWRESLRSESRWYATVDIRDAFHRLKLGDAAKKYLNMSIQLEDGLRTYEWLVMPMGLSTAPAHWCAFINSTIQAIDSFRKGETDPEVSQTTRGAYCVVYADDILLAGPCEASVSALLRVVLQVLKYMECLVSDDKIQWPSTSVKAMGLRLENGHLGPDPDMIAKIQNMDVPRNKAELRTVLGMLQYVAGYVDVKRWFRISPLQALLSSKMEFKWEKEQQDAWDTLVSGFASIPVSHFSISEGGEDVSSKVLILQTDASDEAYGGVIWVAEGNGDSVDIPKQSANGTAKIIGLYHKRFSPQERRYPAHDREGTAIFDGLVRIRSLIHLFAAAGRKVFLYSDNICALSRMKKMYGEDVNLTRTRRWLRMQTEIADVAPYVQFLHICGEDNGIADWLSRSVDLMRGVTELGTQTDSEGVLCCLAVEPDDGPGTNPTPEPREERRFISDMAQVFGEWSSSDDSQYCGVLLKDIHAHLKTGGEVAAKIGKLARKRFKISETGALLFKCGVKWTIVVPDSTLEGEKKLRIHLVWLVHQGGAFSCHRGVTTTLSRVRESFWWPGMDTLVWDFVKTCLDCVTSRIGYYSRVGVHTGKAISEPNERVLFDFCQARGAFILVGVDCLSNFIMAREVANKDAETVSNFILEWVGLFGNFQLWTSDWEPVFVSQVVRETRHLLGIEEFLGTSYSPATQGQVERACGTIKQAITACTDQPLRQVVRAVVFMNNSTPRPGYSGISPAEVFLGRKMIDPTFNFVAEVTGSGVVDAIADVRSYWVSKVNEQRQQTSDEAGNLVELTPGTSVLRVILDHNAAKPTLRRYGIYRVVRAEGSGYIVTPENEDEEEWLPGHQLCVFDTQLSASLRVGLTPAAAPSREARLAAGTAAAFEWQTDLGERLYVGKIVDVGTSDYGVRYYEINEDGSLGPPSRKVVRTPAAAVAGVGTVKKGRWVWRNPATGSV